jgi:putative Mg2+ transporter-C (MgtC) family protein
LQPIATLISPRDIALRLGAAMIVGAILGINRDLRDKPAGLKTHGLVTIGAALLTMVSISFVAMSATIDGGVISRVTQGIITGIGFLGAGVILRNESGQSVQGLTTAATIWIAACFGIACGAGQWRLVSTALIMTLIVLVIGGPIEKAIYRFWHRKSGKMWDGESET